jgi:CRP-like cAMP-binding protein
MVMVDKKQIINTCSLLLRENINEAECEVLTDKFELQRFTQDEVLLLEGKKDDTLYIIIDGDIMATRDAGGDEYVVLHHLQSGDIAGAMGFIDGNTHSATLRAAKDSHVLMMHRDVLEGMIDSHPQLVYKIMKMIIRSVHQTLLRMNQQFVQMNNYIMKEHGRY